MNDFLNNKMMTDLVARLPYGVIMHTPKGDGHLCSIDGTIFGWKLGVNIKATERESFTAEECKPYLRPIDSMTDEEKKLLEAYASLLTNDFLEEGVGAISDFYNINHLDYHGLIENGFALKAPLGMYKLKE